MARQQSDQSGQPRPEITVIPAEGLVGALAVEHHDDAILRRLETLERTNRRMKFTLVTVLVALLTFAGVGAMKLEETIEDTFPASDAPAWTGTTGPVG